MADQMDRETRLRVASMGGKALKGTKQSPEHIEKRRLAMLGKQNRLGKTLSKEHQIKRFLEKVHKTDSCWLWTSHIDPNGYARLNGLNASIRSYKLFVGEIPEGYDIHHVCENRACVNPSHLSAVSEIMHIRSHIKKRIAGGEKLFGRK